MFIRSSRLAAVAFCCSTFAGAIWLLFFSPKVEVMAASGSLSASDLAGLWQAKLRFGPDVRGDLIIQQIDGKWRAEISGEKAEAKVTAKTIAFQYPDGLNSFQGKFAPDQKITGHWIQPPTLESGSPYASPVTLTLYRPNTWSGNVIPLDSTMTLYLVVRPREDGSVGAFLKNPERNIGWTVQYRIDHIALQGKSVQLLAADKGSEKGRLLAEGIYHPDDQVLSMNFPNRGGTFDFRRVASDEFSNFYPRGRPSVSYEYQPPLSMNDDWPVASLKDVGISQEQIEKMMRLIANQPIDSVNSLELHGILIARHGKLVLEEYFHGENRDNPHDTRSAAKSLTSTLLGAAIHSGVPLKLSSPIYRVMNHGDFPLDLDPRKRAITVEHLLTMSSGLDCDDNDPNSPGREDYLTDESGQTDYYKYTLALPMKRDPGELAVYCSADAHLLGGVIQRASGKSLPELFHELIADPLKIERYYMNLSPSGDAYMGGGVRLLLRDFMKFGQLYLNGGTWNHHRILSQEFAQRAVSPLQEVKDYKPREPLPFLKYGYLWWATGFPYHGRTVRAFYAGGNGGQVVVGIPELDLVIAAYGGNYNDAVMFQTQTRYIPEFILPAVSSRP